MARAIKDLLPTVDGRQHSPIPALVTPLGPEAAIFGGIDLLLKKPAQVDALPEVKDEQALRTEAWSQGLLEAEQLWQQQKAKDLQALRASFEQERADLSDMLHMALSSEIARQFQEIAEQLADSVAELLEPFLEERACALTIQRFSEIARQALDEAVETTPILKGPEHLLAQLSIRCDAQQAQSEETGPEVEDETIGAQAGELSLLIDKTVFETRLKPFVAQLREAVQDE